MTTNKTVILTGATGTIGSAIAKKLVSNEFQLIFTARDEDKAKKLEREIYSINEKAEVKYFLLDLGSKRDIEAFAEQVRQPVDVLINNAAVTPRQKSFTNDQIEMQWAVNVLGYFWMIKAFSPHLSEAKNPRIVNVASYWAGHLDLSDPEFKARSYDNNTAYMQSKQADRMLSKAFANRLKEKGIMVNSCHPGDANSNLSNDLGFGGHEMPEQAAATPAYLAMSDEVDGMSGLYFQNNQESPCRFSQKSDEVERLFEICSGY